MSEHANRMRFVKISIVTTGMMSENMLYERNDSGCPDSPISLKADHIRKKYKTLKKEMNTEIVDYLVQSYILTTDENSSLLDKSRAEKCDFILRRLIRDSDCLTKLRTLLLEEPKDMDVFDCFRSLLCNTSPEPEIPNSEKQENDSAVFVHNLKLGENRGSLLDLFRRHINNKSINSILDDFLQEYFITVQEHEEISWQSERCRTKAAEQLLAAVERSCPRKLFSILKSYDAEGLADRLQLRVEEMKIGVDKDLEASFTVRIRGGKIFLFSADKTKVEIKINSIDETGIDMTCLLKVTPEAEATLLEKMHCSVEKTSMGSIIILLQTETGDAVEKLRQFIESGDISKFLKQLFETKGGRKLLKKDKYTVEIKIKKVESSATANVLQGTETPQFEYKSILERCHCFLLEELEPGYFLRNDDIAAIFEAICADVKKQKTRSAKNELILEHLKKQPEETIQLVLEKLEKRNSYIYRQLFPKTEKYQNIDIEQVKRNIMDNLPELLDEISVEILQPPFLSRGIITCEELDALRSSSDSLRTENLQFVKLVLHRGAEAIRIFLGSLENSRGESELCRRLTKTEIEDTCECKSRNTNIKYEAFEEENGLLFTGNFLIESMKDTSRSPEQECLCVEENEIKMDYDNYTCSESMDNLISNESDCESSSDFYAICDSVKFPAAEKTDNVEEQYVHELLQDTEMIKDFVSCVRCHKRFDQDDHKPFLLPCLDGLCKMCVADPQLAEKKCYRCAKCLTDHICMDKNEIILLSDPTREVLSEIFCFSQDDCSVFCEMCTSHQAASHRCVDCSLFVCMDCVKLHERLKQYQSHEVLEIHCLLTGEVKKLRLFSSTKNKLCPFPGHEKENVKFFCSNPCCLKPICIVCALNSHKDHTFSEFSNVREESISKVQEKIRNVLMAQTSLAELTTIDETNVQKSLELQNEIRIYFGEAKKVVETRENSLLSAVSAKLSNKQSFVEDEKKRLKSFADSCKQALYYGRLSSEINNVQSYLYVAESIQLRLENLEDQLHENQVTNETMKFSRKPPITSFETYVHRLGKLSSSEAISSRSNVVITPFVYEVHQSVQFQIQLLSSFGKEIVDEDVHVLIELNGKVVTDIQCAVEKSFYTGSWIPDEAMQFTWTVVSNGIQLETLHGILDVQTSDVKTKEVENKDGAFIVEISEGLSVKIYAGNIANLYVDCIINATDENLTHDGGVAATISEAAGYQFDQESILFVAENGPLQVGSCCVTTAGKLPNRCVIHTVGPRWDEYSDKSECLLDLQKCVKAAFEKADELKMISIAIPATAFGIFGIPRDECVEQYYKAVISFSSTHTCQSLKVVHLVDKDESMVKAMQERFLQKTSSTSTNTSISGNANKESNTINDSKLLEKRDQLEMPLSTSDINVTISDTLQIRLNLGNITNVVTDVLVCPQDKFCSSDNQIAKDIFNQNAGLEPTSEEKEYGHIFGTVPADKSSWKMIMQAVYPIYDLEHSKNPAKFGKSLNTMIQKIIKIADEAMFTSIAIPLLIEDKDGYVTPVDICALNFMRAVTETTMSSLKRIHLVLRNKEDEKEFLEFFSDAYKISSLQVISSIASDGDNIFEKNIKSKSDDEGNCRICKNAIKSPKQLDKCGHVFCQDCIDRCLMLRPEVCPSCGPIYERKTGDQPPGILSFSKCGQSPKGFNDSKDCIILEYVFPNGHQGKENQHPGRPYKGVTRRGYLPNNSHGRQIAKLLNVAFSRRLVFTISRSQTRGEDDVITWNGIPHKTRIFGGPEKFAYPDPPYLNRVLESLATRGVTPESADDPQEYKEFTKLFCDMADVEGPISQVVIVSDPAKCPTGFTLIDSTYGRKEDASLRRDRIFSKTNSRYLCVEKIKNPLPDRNILVDLTIIEDTEAIPAGFSCIAMTADTREKVLKSKILCVRYMPYESTNDAICDIILLPKGTSSTPKDYTYVGKLNFLGLCYKIACFNKTGVPMDF